MKLNEFKIRAPRGTFYAAKPTDETREAILDFLSDNKIPNPLKSELIHCTICYSRVWCAERALGDIDPHWKGNFETYNVWQTSSDSDSDEPGTCLTMSFICPEMTDRHMHLRKHGATHDYPEYKPHVTLSYEVPEDYNHIVLPIYGGPLHFNHEFSEPLNVKFKSTKLNK